MSEYIFAFLAAAATGTLAGLGVGGGGLLVIYLVLIKGMGQIEAQGINLAFFVVCSLVSQSIHQKKRRILKKALLCIAPAAVLGALLGSFLCTLCPPAVVRRCFGVLLLFSGLWELFSQHREGKMQISEN